MKTDVLPTGTGVRDINMETTLLQQDDCPANNSNEV